MGAGRALAVVPNVRAGRAARKEGARGAAGVVSG
jgi:hypothetical protein